MFGETKTDAKFSETQFCIKIILPLTDITEYRKDVLFYRMFWEMPHQKWFNRVFEFEDFFIQIYLTRANMVFLLLI